MNVDLTTFKMMAEENLERFSTKAERVAFLTGLSVGARAMKDEERLRVLRDLSAVWKVEEKADRFDDANEPRGAGRPARRIDVGNDMMAKLAQLGLMGK